MINTVNKELLRLPKKVPIIVKKAIEIILKPLLKLFWEIQY